MIGAGSRGGKGADDLVARSTHKWCWSLYTRGLPDASSLISLHGSTRHHDGEQGTGTGSLSARFWLEKANRLPMGDPLANVLRREGRR